MFAASPCPQPLLLPFTGWATFTARFPAQDKLIVRFTIAPADLQGPEQAGLQPTQCLWCVLVHPRQRDLHCSVR